MQQNRSDQEIVKTALEYEQVIHDTAAHLRELNGQSFREAPAEPIRKTVTRSYPEIKPEVRIDWLRLLLPLGFSLALSLVSMILINAGAIGMILGIVGGIAMIGSIIWIVYYFIKIRPNAKKIETERIRNSEEYKSRCADLDRQYDREQAAYDETYREEKRVFDTETMPAYEQEKQEWEQAKEEQLQKARGILADYSGRLNQEYESTHLIPAKYHTIDALSFFSDVLTTSGYTFRESVDMYEVELTRRREEALIEAIQTSNQIAAAHNTLLDEANGLLNRIGEGLEKMRRDANLRGMAEAVQRHNANKRLSELSENFEKYRKGDRS